jgi:hypothetical protein
MLSNNQTRSSIKIIYNKISIKYADPLKNTKLSQ